MGHLQAQTAETAFQMRPSVSALRFQRPHASKFRGKGNPPPAGRQIQTQGRRKKRKTCRKTRNFRGGPRGRATVDNLLAIAASARRYDFFSTTQMLR